MFHRTQPWILVVATALAACKPEESPAAAPVPEPEPEARTPAPAEPEPAPSEAETGEAAPAQAGAAGATWGFEDVEPGQIPEGWSARVGKWKVEAIEGAAEGGRGMVQAAKSGSGVFNVLLLDGEQHGDVDISVRMRARAGKIDQGGGPVWRAADERNYYTARYNPLEDNFRVYHVKRGKRVQIGSADVKVDPKAWHTVRVKMVADHIECFLDGEKHLDVNDTTFTEAGAVGLWTKADAQTEFDQLEVTAP